MEERWKELAESETWDSQDSGNLPKGLQAIRTKWIFNSKLKEDGTVARYKARLVTQEIS